jgi:hypothetical protein
LGGGGSVEYRYVGTVSGSTYSGTVTLAFSDGSQQQGTFSVSKGSAPPPAGDVTIAYVRPNDQSGDEIRFIEPDGSRDRLIWSTGKPDPYGLERISSLDWRPGGSELAFVSDHEWACSIFESDLYGIRPDGSGYRRITNAPACAELAAYPTGAVVVEIQNRTESAGPFFVYVQGAPGPRFVSTSSDTVLVDEVADLGAGILQFVTVTDGTYRWWGLPVDVRAGSTVHAPRQVLSADAFTEFGAQSPSWHSSGTKLAFVLGLGSMRQIGANPGPLSAGDSLLGGVATAGVVNDHLAWGPIPAVADSLLYATFASDGFVLDGIYLAAAGGSNRGVRLAATEGLVQGLAWLPDGSGFVYSAAEDFDSHANIYAYSFASDQITPLTSFTNEFAGQLTVSPDGQRIVFERAADLYFPSEPPALWIMNRDGGDQRLLVENGRAPAWSR